MAVQENNHVITVRELNTQLWKFIGTLFAIGLMAGSWYMSTTNKRLDNVVEAQNLTNMKIEKFSITTELTDLKVTKLESRSDSFATKMSDFDKELATARLKLQSQQQQLDRHEKKLNEMSNSL